MAGIQGVHIATETGQEVVQEAVTIAGVNAGKAASGLETDSLSDIGQRLKDTAVSSALTFGVLNVAGLSGRLANTVITRESLGNLSAQESRAVNKAVTVKYAEQLKQDGVSQEHIDTYVKESEKNATSKEAKEKNDEVVQKLTSQYGAPEKISENILYWNMKLGDEDAVIVSLFDDVTQSISIMLMKPDTYRQFAEFVNGH